MRETERLKQHLFDAYGGFADRLLHRCQVINIRGRSYRLRDLERLLK